MLKSLKALNPATRIRNKKASENDPLTSATKEFIKAPQENGIAALPTIIEACSSAAADSLASQMTVLDLINKYLNQAYLSRQLRAVDLLRFLSDQDDNKLFMLMDDGHPVVKSLESFLNVKSRTHMQKVVMMLLDHLCRKPQVPASIVELHGKYVVGIKNGRPTIILSDQDAVADDIIAATGEADLLAELVAQPGVDQHLTEEVHQRIINTRTRLVRSADTSTSDAQTIHIVSAIEIIDAATKKFYAAKGSTIVRSPSQTSGRSSPPFAELYKGKSKLPRSNTEDELDNYGEGGSGSKPSSVRKGHSKELSSNNPFKSNPFSDPIDYDAQFQSLKM